MTIAFSNLGHISFLGSHGFASVASSAAMGTDFVPAKCTIPINSSKRNKSKNTKKKRRGKKGEGGKSQIHVFPR
jgi:hypothetical protein